MDFVLQSAGIFGVRLTGYSFRRIENIFPREAVSIVSQPYINIQYIDERKIAPDRLLDRNQEPTVPG